MHGVRGLSVNVLRSQRNPSQHLALGGRQKHACGHRHWYTDVGLQTTRTGTRRFSIFRSFVAFLCYFFKFLFLFIFQMSSIFRLGSRVVGGLQNLLNL